MLILNCLITCVNLHDVLLHLGGKADGFFWTHVSRSFTYKLGCEETFDTLLPFHKVSSEEYRSDSMLKGNNVLCDWNIRNSFPATESWLSLSKKQKLFCFCYFTYLTEREGSSFYWNDLIILMNCSIFFLLAEQSWALLQISLYWRMKKSSTKWSKVWKLLLVLKSVT